MPGIDPKVLDFIPQILEEISKDSDGVEGAMSGDSILVTFGEAFFDQFFGSLGHNITGFSLAAKRRAIAFVEGLSPGDGSDAQVRRLVVAFEEFCDLAKDAQGNYGGSSVGYAKGVALVQRMLILAENWVAQLPDDEAQQSLIARIGQARIEIESVT